MGGSVAVSVVSFILFVSFQAQGIAGGDSGDLVTAAATFGVAHPPGYPLYMLVGWAVSKLPVLTVAWRVGLLSSLPHAVVVGLLFAMVTQLTKSKLSALFASILLVGNYLFFLYSTTPEVFALLDLFIASVMWLALRFYETKNVRWVYWIVFLFGLSLTHHHLILFFTPAMAYWWWRERTYIAKKLSFGRIIALFIAGLLPYLYVPIAARGGSIINWDRAVNLHNFIQLVTRADYGTFLSNEVFGALPIQRLLQLKAMGQYMLLDFGLAGVSFFLIGLSFLWRGSRKMFSFFVLSLLFLGPVFLFYASFPLVNRFTLATYERFLLPFYMIAAVMVGVGHAESMRFLTDALSRLAPHIAKKFLYVSLAAITFLFAFVRGGYTVWKFWGLPQDRTAQEAGEDLFAGVPPGSIVVLGRDTALFTAQYVRYVPQYRPDTIVLHAAYLGSSDYQQTIRRVFPDLIIPDRADFMFLGEFFTANAAYRHVFSNIQFSLPKEWYWVPHGLTFELVSSDRLPRVSDLQKRNDALWATLKDPTKGILSRYNHLMLSDVRDMYASSRVEYGKMILKAGDSSAAKRQFDEAIRLDTYSPLSDAYVYKGLSHLFLNECDEALTAFATARSMTLAPKADVFLYEGITYRDCVRDAVRAEELFSRYEKERLQTEVPLEKL